MSRKYNFNPGPAALPLDVLQKIQQELLDYRETGMSVMEISHRSKEFGEIMSAAKASIRKVMDIPENYEIIFAGGGASMQFAMIPMNFLAEGATADYVNTGAWSKKAIKEAKLFGNVNVAATSEDANFNYIPEAPKFTGNATYVHITSNNTIFGTQWQSFPNTEVPLIADMSSDIMSRRVDISRFSLIYAGAQKNMGPAGVTVVILRKELLEKTVSHAIPTMLQYQTYVNKDSAYNTPPVYAIYTVGLVAKWIEDMGGLEKIEEINKAKAKLLYGTMEDLPEFYKGTARVKDRSFMNVTFRLPSEDLEKEFIQEGLKNNFNGLKGHRSVGGIRISMYNPSTLESIEKLTEFMKNFAKKHA